jgi:hypothetical protein
MTQMPPAAPGPVGYQTPPQGSGLAMGSMICGISSLVLSLLSFCIWFLSLPLGIVAVVLALMAKGKAAPSQQGMVRTGLITGIIGIILSIAIPAVLYMGLRTAGSKLQQEAERLQREMERQQQQQQRQPATTQPSEQPVTDEGAKAPSN